MKLKVKRSKAGKKQSAKKQAAKKATPPKTSRRSFYEEDDETVRYRLKLREVGSSFICTIPREILLRMDLQLGDSLIMSHTDGSGRIVIFKGEDV